MNSFNCQGSVAHFPLLFIWKMEMEKMWCMLILKWLLGATSFCRNIKGFMVQTGDPTGTGKGGKSIWGKKFNDEIVPSLKVSYIQPDSYIVVIAVIWRQTNPELLYAGSSICFIFSILYSRHFKNSRLANKCFWKALLNLDRRGKIRYPNPHYWLIYYNHFVIFSTMSVA